MAVTAGSNQQTNGRAERSALEPYYERLEPIDGGYSITRGDGRVAGQILIYDDRVDAGAIHVQFKTGRGKFTKTAVFHVETIGEYEDLIEALTLAQKQFPPD